MGNKPIRRLGRSVGLAIVATLGLMVPLLATSSPPAWANSGFHGNGTCPHDNGTADSSACYYGQVQYTVQSTAVPSTYNAGYIAYTQNQLRQRVGIYGGVNSQFFEVGFDQFYPNGWNSPVYSTYAATEFPNGSIGFGWLCNMSYQQTVDGWTLSDIYSGNGNWVAFAYDQNGNGGSCNFQTNNVYNQIYGAAVSEGGSVFCVCGGGFFGDGSYMNTFNVLTTQICLAYDPPGTICGGPFANWTTYETDYACPGTPCMNGNFFGSDYWSSNYAR